MVSGRGVGVVSTAMADSGWYPDPKAPGQQRYWDGQAWSAHVAPLPQAAVPVVHQQRAVRPAHSAHGLLYWVTIGWLWQPTKWMGRVLLWLFLWPLGLWRSVHKNRVNEQAKLRRAS
jgi:hypothetical protein